MGWEDVGVRGGGGGAGGVSPPEKGGNQDEFPEQHQEGAEYRSDWEEEKTGPSEHQGLNFIKAQVQFGIKILASTSIITHIWAHFGQRKERWLWSIMKGQSKKLMWPQKKFVQSSIAPSTGWCRPRAVLGDHRRVGWWRIWKGEVHFIRMQGAFYQDAFGFLFYFEVTQFWS